MTDHHAAEEMEFSGENQDDNYEYGQIENLDSPANLNNTQQKVSYVVGIGASAGGLEAIEAFFDKMPSDTDMAFVVIQHLSPDFKSLMDELLARHTEMPIHRVEDGIEIQPNEIYLIPPKKEMVISNGRLLLTDKDPTGSLSLPIDIFLRSLAQDRGEKAVAVILSGTGTDGSRGIVEIQKWGGLIIVQDENTAKFDGMPKSAIATKTADFVLPPESMPETLLKFVKEPQKRDRLQNAKSAYQQTGEFPEIFSMLRDKYGIDFAFYKPTTVGRRIQRRISLNSFSKVDDYIEKLKKEPEELSLLYHDLLIGVTKFFRDKEAFDTLAENVIDKLVQQTTTEEGIRIWDAGCATGEETYSLAILLHEAITEKKLPMNIKIFATDVHRESIDTAANGLYSSESVENISDQRLARYFLKKNDKYQIQPELRQMIVFAEHNIVNDPPFTKIDLITCRNLLIYFQPIAQKKVLSLFHFSLKPQGYMFLGPSETLGELENGFDTIDHHWKIFHKTKDVLLPRSVRFPLGPSLDVQKLSAPATTRNTGISDLRLAKAYDALLSKHVPPSLLVNERHELIHTFGNAADYLRQSSGRATLNILSMVEGDLRIALAAAMQRAAKEKSNVTYKGIRQQTTQGEKHLMLTVEPLSIKSSDSTYLLISIEEVKPIKPIKEKTDQHSFNAGQESQHRIEDLEEELQYTREHLQAAIEELETSNEELQASNEELLASNEELQSTNEELHSVNEELYTVNGEYERKIHELTQMTNDMDNLLRSTEIGTLFLDRNLRIRKFTPAIADSFQLLPQDIGRPIEHISYNVNNGEKMLSDITEVLNTGQSSEKEVQNRNGRWYLKRVFPYLNEHKEIQGVVITFIDISNIKRVQVELEESESRYSRAVKVAKVAVWDYIPETDQLNVYGMKELLGYENEEIPCTFDAWLELVHPDDRDKMRQTMRNHLNGITDSYESEHRMYTKNGDIQWIRATGSKTQEQDQPCHVIGTKIDITSRRKNEDKIRKTLDELEAKNNEMEHFVYTVSHDLKSPLVTVKGFAGWLKKHIENNDKEKIQSDITSIDRAVEKMNQLLEDLLELSRSGKLIDQKTDFKLEQLCREAVNMFDESIKKQSINVDIADNLGTVHGDQRRIQQVLENLIGNAVKFMGNSPDPRIEIGARHDGDKKVFYVKDSGIGVDSRYKEKIFGMFNRLDADSEGSGMGLAIVKRILEAHNGDVWVESEGTGKGATFCFTIPANK